MNPGVITRTVNPGDTLTYPITIKRNGVAGNESGRTWAGTVRRGNAVLDDIAVTTNTASAGTGLITLTIPDTESIKLRYGMRLVLRCTSEDVDYFVVKFRTIDY
jgi:hypothetical protein